MTVAQALSHQGGVPGISPSNLVLDPSDWYDWEKIIGLIERQPALYPVGTANAYHAITHGFLTGELVRRCDPQRRTLGRFFREEVAAPLGLDLHIGTPEDVHHRISPLLGSEGGNAVDPDLLRVAFQAVDSDGSGRIDADEVLQLLQKLGERNSTKPDSSVVKRLMEGADVDQDGTIDFQEFVAAFSRMRSDVGSASIARMLQAAEERGGKTARATVEAAFMNPPIDTSMGRGAKTPAHNTREWRLAELPAANGHGNARGLARMYAMLAHGGELDGVRVLSPAAIDRATKYEVRPGVRVDMVLQRAVGWSRGFLRNDAASGQYGLRATVGRPAGQPAVCPAPNLPCRSRFVTYS